MCRHLLPEDKQEEVRAFVTEVNRSLTLYKRISAVEFTAEPLPRNALVSCCANKQ